jgi:hypothetical protein
MAMLVLGRAPTGPEGSRECFRRSIGEWIPFAELVTTLCPDEASPCRHWGSNDGDGLDAAGAAALAAKLEELRDSGAIEAYWARVEAAMAVRRSPFKDLFDDVDTEAPLAEPYRDALNEVDEFIAFLKASGGFAIW